MDQSLNTLLEDINKAADGLSTQYFKPPGIFHNAIVKHLTTDSVMDFTKILRDTKDRESSMFRVDKGVVKRKDGKEGILDYLSERDLRQRKNRNFRILEPVPVIQIPKNFYLEQQRLELSNSIEIESLRKLFNPDASSTTRSQYSQLLSRFSDDENAKRLLISLFQGSVIIEDNTPMETVINILNEINNLWPGSKSNLTQQEMAKQYLKLQEMKVKLEKQIQEQDAKIIENSANDIQQLIQEKHKELEELERLIMEKKKKNSSETTS